MDAKILVIYCLCADLLKAIGHMEDPQQQMSDAEVITTGLVAMLCFRGNYESARALLSAPRYIPPMLSRSRLNRRLHRLNELSLTLFELLGQRWKYLNTESIDIIDSFPVAMCDNYRIPRAKAVSARTISRAYRQQETVLVWTQRASPGDQRRAASRVFPDARFVP